MRMFCIDDGGEQYWIAHEKEEALKKDAFEHYDIDPDDIESITEIPLDEKFRIGLVDGYDGEEYPTEPYQDDLGRWFVEATVREWLTRANAGDMIASTIF